MKAHQNINKVMKDDFYVNDLMSGANSKDETKSIIDKIIDIDERYGFSLRKCSPNGIHVHL